MIGSSFSLNYSAVLAVLALAVMPAAEGSAATSNPDSRLVGRWSQSNCLSFPSAPSVAVRSMRRIRFAADGTGTVGSNAMNWRTRRGSSQANLNTLCVRVAGGSEVCAPYDIQRALQMDGGRLELYWGGNPTCIWSKRS